MAENSVTSKILKSSFWQYMGSWLDKIIGFVSTIILARILVPDDFGVVAASAIIVGMFHVIASVGTGAYLIRKKDISDRDLNIGWTINICMKSMSALCIYGMSWWIADFMVDERLVQVLQVAAIPPFLAGFANVGMVLHRRDYNFKPSFIVGITNRILGFIAKISLAYILNSYWAFMLSEILATTVYLVATFVMHPYRPKLCFSGWKQQWKFSQWVLLKSIFVYIRFKIDNILLSRFFALEVLGAYTVGKDVATIPAGQIVGPVMAPLYVSLSSVYEDKELFADRVHKSIALLFIILLPISFGTYITADSLVAILLGSQWHHVTPLVMILAFSLLPGTLSRYLTNAMTALGKVKTIFILEVVLGISTIIAFVLLAENMNIEEFALLRVSLNAINIMIILIVLACLSKVSITRMFGLMIFPTLFSIAMVGAIQQINIFIVNYDYGIKFFLQVLFGAVFYFTNISAYIYLLRNRMDEYQFIWKSFYVGFFQKIGFTQ